MGSAGQCLALGISHRARGEWGRAEEGVNGGRRMGMRKDVGLQLLYEYIFVRGKIKTPDFLPNSS